MKRTLLLAVLTLFLPLSQTFAQAPEEAQLTALAQEAVAAQNDILVTGDVEGSLRKRPQAAGFRGGIQGHFESLVHRREMLAKKGADYKSHKTDMKINSTKVEGTRATQTATEHVVLALDPALHGPTETEYKQDHIFEYVKEGDQWRMASDTIVIPPPLPEEIKGPPGGKPTVQAPPGHRPSQNRQKPGIALGPRRAPGVAFASMVRPASFAMMYATYTPSAAVNYALTYWSSYNTSQYRSYSNDCTNFVSQSVRAGGWPFDETGDRTLPDTWYYGSFTFTTSYSWAGAHNFNQFFNQSGRGFVATYFEDMLTGDVLQADFEPDGNIQHSMVVTSKDANNTLYLTYHTNDNRNRPLPDLLAIYPNARWYGLAMYYSF